MRFVSVCGSSGRNWVFTLLFLNTLAKKCPRIALKWLIFHTNYHLSSHESFFYPMVTLRGIMNWFCLSNLRFLLQQSLLKELEVMLGLTRAGGCEKSLFAPLQQQLGFSLLQSSFYSECFFHLYIRTFFLIWYGIYFFLLLKSVPFIFLHNWHL
jgi:hypothetical protein